MKRLWLVVCLLLWLTACSSQTVYDDEDIAAVVMGEKITVGDIRFIHDVNDQDLPMMVKEIVKEEIMVQEAKQMGITVSEEVEEIKAFSQLPPEDLEDPLRDFVERQAKAFDMTEEEYYQAYTEKSATRSQYVNQYIVKLMGEPHSGDEGHDYTESVNEYVDNLLTKYADDIEIKIQ